MANALLLSEVSSQMVRDYFSGKSAELVAAFERLEGQTQDEKVRWSAALFGVAVEDPDSRSVAVLQELLLDFMRGRLHATNNHLGPMFEDHFQASSEGLQRLVRLGIFTDDGQPRVYDAACPQRAYVAGYFLTALDTPVERVLDLFESTRSCYAFVCAEGDAAVVRRRPSRGDGRGVVDVRRGLKLMRIAPGVTASLALDGGDLELHSFRDRSDLLDCGVLEWLTLDDGRGHTHVNLDPTDDPYGLERFAARRLLHRFIVWEGTWPAPQESPRQSLETLLADAVASAGCVLAASEV